MKQTSRKKVLLSSVAMMMVATVSLGSATYAWFTSSTSATASKINVKTVKSSELKLSNATSGWTDTLEYNNTDKVLKPASSVNGVNWFTANASGKTGYATTVDKVTELSELKGYVFADQLNISNAGKADVNDVTISFKIEESESVAEQRYLRLALVEAEEKGAGKDMVGSFKDAVYAETVDTALAIKEIKTEADNSKTLVTEKIDAKSGANVDINIGKLIGTDTTPKDDTEKTTRYYNLYIWFEGQDEQCKDANAGNELPGITFTVTGDTVDTTA